MTGIRLVQLKSDKSLLKYAYVPIDSKLAASDAAADQQKVAEIISQLVKQSGVTTKHVAAGIPSSQVFTTVADVDRLPPAELAKAIPYQADSLIPTPLAESKLDWALLGDSPADKTKQEILLSSVTNKYVETRLDLLESVGLDVIALEPDSLALARAIAAPDAAPQLLLDMGSRATDLVIVMNGMPHLTRSIPTGTETIIKSAAQNLNVDQKQAEQFIFKFGLSKDKLEGQVYQAVSSSVDMLVNEIEKSIKFFNTRYNNSKIERLVIAGNAAIIPEFPLYMANKFSLNAEIGNAWRNVTFSADRQNELMSISSQFSVAAGLAERTYS